MSGSLQDLKFYTISDVRLTIPERTASTLCAKLVAGYTFFTASPSGVRKIIAFPARIPNMERALPQN